MPLDRIRFLDVSATLTDALLLQRVRMRHPPRPALEAEAVEAAERALGGITLPDDLLAYLAATGRDPDELATIAMEAADAGLSAEYVAFARDELGYVCAALSRDANGALPVGVWEGGDAPPVLDSTLVRYVRTKYELGAGEGLGAKLEKARQVFAPCVVRQGPALARRVDHPKFGEGDVVQEIHDGNHKLVVDFAAGRKTIMARFLRVLEVAS